jgi:AcrR family transcriptional regulator
VLDAIVAVVAERGYGGTKIGEIAARAGVSRATFYELFADKEECFLAAHDMLAGSLKEAFDQELGRAASADAVRVAVTMIVGLARTEPAALTFLMHEALLAGPSARERHRRLTDHLADSIGRSSRRAPGAVRGLSIHPKILVGGVVRLLCIQVRRHGAPSEQLLPELLTWTESYATATQETPRVLIANGFEAHYQRQVRPNLPRTLPRGRHRLSKDVVKSIQRERIAYATAEIVGDRDAVDVAVSDIVAAAGVSREVFYANFSDKEQAFLATHQLIFEQLMAASTSSFFAPDVAWPDRVWNAGLAFTGLLAAAPSFAHFAFVSAYGIGEIGVRRVDETILAFGLFLEDGYRYRPEAADLPRVVSDAIAAAIMEAFAFHVRNDETAELPRLVPAFAHTALAPFMGAAAAGEFIDGKLRA